MIMLQQHRNLLGCLTGAQSRVHIDDALKVFIRAGVGQREQLRDAVLAGVFQGTN